MRNALTISLVASLFACSDQGFTGGAVKADKSSESQNTDEEGDKGDGGLDPGSETTQGDKTDGGSIDGTGDGAGDADGTLDDTQDEGGGSDLVVDDGEICVLSNDFVKLKYPKEIQDCIDAGKVYNFYDKKCTSVAKASSFECDWKGFVGGVETLLAGVSGGADQVRSVVDETKAAGGKLVGCGEGKTPDGHNMIIWQVFIPPKDDDFDCVWDGKREILTACVPTFSSQAQADEWLAGDKAERVRDCIE